ncbi:MAG: endonuclease/exonuclease/phosphatase family protein [Opitutales bacterium]
MKRKLNFILWISWALFSIFLVFKSFEVEETIAPTPPKLDGELRLMSWNLGSYCLCSRYFEGVYYKSKAKPQSQRQAIAKTIAEINPDVLCVQELGYDYLELFQRELKALNLEYPYFTLLNNLDENRCIAIFSKIPFAKVKQYDDVKFDYQDGKFESVRGLILVKVQDIFIATLHAKSRRAFEKYPEDKYCEIYRQRELESFAKILSHYKDEKLILCGDFNEDASHANIKSFKEIANLSQIYQGESSDSWTYSYKNGKAQNTFDFFLASPTLTPKAQAQATVHKAYKTASDHRSIYVNILLDN